MKVDKLEDIATLKTTQVDLKKKTTVEITELKKETGLLFIKKPQLFSSRGEVEEAIAKAYQHIHESMAKLDIVAKAKRLREVIV